MAVQVCELQGVGRLSGVVTVDPDSLDQLQLALSQSARLVGAKDRDAAEVLDGRKAFDQYPVRRQSARPAGQVEGNDGRQQLGRQADRQGDRKEQRVEERSLQGHVDGEDTDHKDQRDPTNQETEGADAVLEIGLWGSLGKAVSDGPVARLRAGSGDLGHPGAAHDAGPEEGQTGPILVLARIELSRHGVLERRGRLAGERRLVHEQVIRLDQAGVRGDDIARAEDNHVASNDVADQDLLALSVSDHCGAQCQSSLEGGHGGLRARFLDEAQECAHGHDREDDPRLHAIADSDADHAGGDENQDQRTGELTHEHGQRSTAALAAERVGAVLAKPAGSLYRGQAGRRRQTRGRGRGRARRGRRGGGRCRTTPSWSPRWRHHGHSSRSGRDRHRPLAGISFH